MAKKPMRTSSNMVSFNEPLVSYESRIANSRLGYKVELFDETGEFSNFVFLPDDTSKVTRLDCSLFTKLAFELKEQLKGYYTYLIPRYLPTTIGSYHDAIKFIAEEISSGKTLNESISSAIIANPENFTNPIKSLIRYLILNEYSGLSIEKAEDVLRIEGYASNRNSYLTLFSIDPELGPFTREELRVLRHAIKNEGIYIADRLLLALCIQFGLRPIQLSLLKVKDFIEDTLLGVSYLNVPRIKQKGLRFRREEFTKRVIDDELTVLIKRVIANNRESYGELSLEDPPLFFRKVNIFSKVDKKWRKFTESSKVSEGYYSFSKLEYYESPDKRAYIHHVKPENFVKRLQDVASYISMSPRTGKPFYLTPYRFRYTVGTNAVVEGMTEEEVAYLLDHSSTDSVKHYFRYTREIWELLENATEKRTEQQHFTAAWSREVDLSENIYGKEVIELHAFTAIGKCQKKIACYLEPAVSCYSCDKFCPNKEMQSHKNVLITLNHRKQLLAQSVSKTLSKQLDEAIAGCKAAIAYAEGCDVVNINNRHLDD